MEIVKSKRQLSHIGRQSIPNPFLNSPSFAKLVPGTTYEVSFENQTQTAVISWLIEAAHDLGYKLRKDVDILNKIVYFMLFGEYKKEDVDE